MGVSGCGKTLIGKMLSEELSTPFYDADDFHTKESKGKMSSGIPLNDEDRHPWLEKINEEAKKHTFKGCVIACSALKAKYRRLLNKGIESNVQWVYLQGDYDTIYSRMNARSDHYMHAEMLQSQFDDLEEPENAINIKVALAPEQIIKDIKQRLK
ncbi:gluconokinase [Ekhidna sp.]|uniref:gluconokinase n=1 Tax=Ekhidna sp. TaxID=2608089 RepID=UPI003BAD1EBC